MDYNLNNFLISLTYSNIYDCNAQWCEMNISWKICMYLLNGKRYQNEIAHGVS